jgi:hypothetical protein
MQINRGMLAQGMKYMGLSELATSARWTGAAMARGMSNTLRKGAAGGMRQRMAWGMSRAAVSMGFGTSTIPARAMGRLGAGAFTTGFLGTGTSMGMGQRAARIGMLGGAGYLGYRSTFGRRRRR